MPELDWIGKRYVVGHAEEVPLRALRRVPEASVGEGSGNVIVHGDNLEALRALLPRYRKQVKLVFIDPPYNADDETWIYNDRIHAPEFEPLLGRVGAEGEDPLRHDKWLCMMYPRLALLRRLLSPEGTIFISIGDNEIHHLRMLMDEIFGARNFLGCAVWHKGVSRNAGCGLIGSTHNYIVIYASDRTKLSAGESSFREPDGRPLTTWWTGERFGDSREARRELQALFPEARDLFPIPKPTRLVRRIVELATSRGSRDIVLDCFAGSGTTAHAVLKQNAADGGNRRFILVEMDDFADRLTAERVRRAIYAEKRICPAPGAGFDYFELGGEVAAEPIRIRKPEGANEA